MRAIKLLAEDTKNIVHTTAVEKATVTFVAMTELEYDFSKVEDTSELKYISIPSFFHLFPNIEKLKNRVSPILQKSFFKDISDIDVKKFEITDFRIQQAGRDSLQPVKDNPTRLEIVAQMEYSVKNESSDEITSILKRLVKRHKIEIIKIPLGILYAHDISAEGRDKFKLCEQQNLAKLNLKYLIGYLKNLLLQSVIMERITSRVIHSYETHF